MKKIWVFVLGVIAGIVLTILFAIIAASTTKQRSGLNMFENPGDCLISKSNLKVFQTLKPNIALATINGDFSSGVYLVINNEGKSYYDNMIIKLPAGKCFKQIGTYQYQNKEESWKTVPVVQIM